MFRSIGAVVAAFAAWSVLWVGANTAMQAAWPSAFEESGATSQGGLLVGILVYSILLSIFSGWLAGRIAAKAGLAHAFVAGMLLLAVGIGVQASVWDAMPLWYHVLFLIAILPANLVGGWLAVGGPRSAPTAMAM